MNSKPHDISGACLCGGISYRIIGQARDIIDCHCENCRRTHGHVAAYTAVNKADLIFSTQKTLSWYHDKSPDIHRGFCNQCGASLLWDAGRANNRISIAAGSLDPGHGLKTIGHVFVAESGEYYQIEDDLPQFAYSNADQLESDA